MTKSSSRRVVVLRDIPSNLVEEAILVLKSDGAVNEKFPADKRDAEKKKDFLIIREAEMIINNFVNSSRNMPAGNKPKEKSGRKLFMDLFINTSLIAVISILIYLVCKAL